MEFLVVNMEQVESFVWQVRLTQRQTQVVPKSARLRFCSLIALGWHSRCRVPVHQIKLVDTKGLRVILTSSKAVVNRDSLTLCVYGILKHYGLLVTSGWRLIHI